MVPIDCLLPGERGCVTCVDGDSTIVTRMAEMGIVAGSEVKMVQNGSPCILQLNNCKLCLRGEMTSQIFVQPLCQQ